MGIIGTVIPNVLMFIIFDRLHAKYIHAHLFCRLLENINRADGNQILGMGRFSHNNQLCQSHRQYLR